MRRQLLILAAMASGGWLLAADDSARSREAFTEPCQSIEVAAPEPGRVAAVHVRRGSVVRPGDLLLELDSAVLEAAVRVAEQRITATAELDARRVDQQNKHRRYETMQGLRGTGAVTAEELLTAETDLRIAELQVRAAEEELQRARLELAELEERLLQRQVRAPLAGVVTDVWRETGEFVSASEPQVVTLVDLSRLRATFYLPTANACRLQEGQSITVLFDVADSGSQAAEGVIEHISPVTQADSGRVRVDVMIDNPAGRYRSGVRCLLPDVGQDGPSTAANRSQVPTAASR